MLFSWKMPLVIHLHHGGQLSHNTKQCRDGFTGGGCGGCARPSPDQMGCSGGAIFMIKKNMRDIMRCTL